jgi:hypothetical protein
LQWERDGQYYHYLTKWVHALNRLSQVTGEKKFNTWAIELAQAAHEGFTYVPEGGGKKRMYWKMSIDLSYPLVTSMGHHDPLDGLVSYLELQISAEQMSWTSGPDLLKEISGMKEICRGKDWATHDPLGMGGLLFDAFRLFQLIVNSGSDLKDLMLQILEDIQIGLNYYSKTNQLNLPANYRLAFRELGLAIGLKALRKMEDILKNNQKSFSLGNRYESVIETLMKYSFVADQIEEFWLKHGNQKTSSWVEHININRVMLGTCLAPESFLGV